MKQYVYVGKDANNLWVRYNDDTLDIIPYKPTLYFIDKGVTNTKYTSLKKNYPLFARNFESMASADELIKEYRQQKRYDEVFGLNIWPLVWINQNYDIDDRAKDLDPADIRVCFFDIETKISVGFPSVETTDDEVNLISISDRSKSRLATGKYYIWVVNKDTEKEWRLEDSRYKDEIDIVPHIFDNEKDMLLSFMEWWKKNPPHIITGWFSEDFDMPYLFGRLTKLFGKKKVNEMSPFGKVRIRDKKRFTKWGGERDMKKCTVAGVVGMDYADVFKKNYLSEIESMKLDFVANMVIGEQKDKDVYSDMKEWQLKDMQSFGDYNLKDVMLVEKIEEKMQFLLVRFVAAYDSLCNFDDTLFETKMGEGLYYRYLIKDGKMPNAIKRFMDKEFKKPGANIYLGSKNELSHVVSYDFSSMYPSLCITLNIGPDTIIDDKRYYYLDKFVPSQGADDRKDERFKRFSDNLPKFLHKIKPEIKQNNECIAGNGVLFRRDFEGILSKMCKKLLSDRKEAKKLKMKYELMEQDETDTAKKEEYRIMKNNYDIRQSAIKILANGCIYGVLGESNFRYYDEDIFTAISCSGRYLIAMMFERINQDLNAKFKTKDKEFVVYGDTDSVTGDSKIYFNGEKKEIETVFNEMMEKYEMSSGDRDMVEIDGIEAVMGFNTKTESMGYHPMTNIVRHKVKDKRMFEISAGDKKVVVTEDHSVVVKRDGEYISVKPMEMKDGDKLIMCAK